MELLYCNGTLIDRSDKTKPILGDRCLCPDRFSFEEKREEYTTPLVP
jgi:hypothetical protein